MAGVDDMQAWPAWVKIAAQVGVPTVLAGYLLFGLSHDVKAEMSGLREDMRTHIAITAAAIMRRDASDAEHLGYLREIARTGLVNCINGAHSTSERAACVGK